MENPNHKADDFMPLEMLSETPGTSTDENEEIDIRHYLLLLWQRLWLILLAAVLSGVAAFIISINMTPVYEASTKILVNEAASSKPTDYNAVLTSERLTRTYSDMMTNEAVLKEVINRLNLKMTYEDLLEVITVSPVRDTQLISVTVEGTNPAQIAQVANMVVQVMGEIIYSIQAGRYSSSKDSLLTQLNDLENVLLNLQKAIDSTNDLVEKERLDSQAVQYRQIYAGVLTSYEQARLAETQSSANIVQINEAGPPLLPVRPKITQNTLLAALLAALLTSGLVFIWDALDDTIKTPDQVTQKLGLPVLAVISQYQNGSGPICQEQPRSPVAEAFRSLRTNVQYANIDDPPRTLLVTSPSPGEGKSVVSANLAVVMAQGGKEVILLDADLRRPTIHTRMNIAANPGLTSLLLQSEIGGAIQKTGTENLLAVASGDLPPNPAELLGSKKMDLILQKMAGKTGMVVIDTPPVLAVADPAVLSTMVDGVLLVIKPGSTTFASALQAIETLRRVNARIIGVILNNVNMKSSRYNYYYQKGYGNDQYHQKEK